jgi:hypothetical protein
MLSRDLEFRDAKGNDIIVSALEDLPRRYQSRLVDVSNRRLKEVFAGEAHYVEVRIRAEDSFEMDKTSGLIGIRFQCSHQRPTAAYPYTFEQFEKGFNELPDGDYVASSKFVVLRLFDGDEVLIGNKTYRKFGAILILEVPGVFDHHVILSEQHLEDILNSDTVS